MIDFPLLSALIWLPVAGGFALLAMEAMGNTASRQTALVVSIVTFLLSLLLYTNFDMTTASMQFQEQIPWISAINANYHLGVDGISMPLIILTTFTTVLVVIAGWEVIQNKVGQYMAAFLIMEGLMVGVFAALDALLFYVFFEAMLIPMFLVIGMWGGPNKVYATLKFFLYTFLGSVFMLIGLIYLYLQSGTWSILEWHQFPLALNVQKWLFLGFLAAFSVKIPMWPVHTWLPDAHVEAPTGGSVILAAIMLKIGGYGFIRFSLPITPDASAALDWLIITLSLIAVVYIGFVALVQQDMKKLIAYSSISHMGFVTLGMFIAFAVFQNTESGRGAALGVQVARVAAVRVVRAAEELAALVEEDRHRRPALVALERGQIHVTRQVHLVVDRHLLRGFGPHPPPGDREGLGGDVLGLVTAGFVHAKPNEDLREEEVIRPDGIHVLDGS